MKIASPDSMPASVEIQTRWKMRTLRPKNSSRILRQFDSFACNWQQILDRTPTLLENERQKEPEVSNSAGRLCLASQSSRRSNPESNIPPSQIVSLHQHRLLWLVQNNVPSLFNPSQSGRRSTVQISQRAITRVLRLQDVPFLARISWRKKITHNSGFNVGRDSSFGGRFLCFFSSSDQIFLCNLFHNMTAIETINGIIP